MCSLLHYVRYLIRLLASIFRGFNSCMPLNTECAKLRRQSQQWHVCRFTHVELQQWLGQRQRQHRGPRQYGQAYNAASLLLLSASSFAADEKLGLPARAACSLGFCLKYTTEGGAVGEGNLLLLQLLNFMSYWETFTSKENILLAMQNAAKGKMAQRNVRKFMKLPDEQKEKAAEELRRHLLSKQYTTSDYVVGHIYDHKPRVIYKLPFYPDRIVHHAMLQALQPLFMRHLIRRTYSAVPGRGQHEAKDYAMLQVKKYEWCLQMDIKKFYPSVKHELLENVLHKIVKDKRLWPILHGLIWKLPGGQNLPIGNYTSQWFGNLFLSKLDNYVLRKIKPSAYCRYCDDFLLFSNDKKLLQNAQDNIKSWLNENLQLGLSKSRLLRCSQGVEWLGYRLFKSYVLVRKKTAQRIKRRWKKLNDKQKASYKGHMQHACCYNFLKSLEKATIHSKSSHSHHCS